MSKLPLPLRNYENLMLLAKRRLMFIEEFNNKKVDFLKIELIAVQLRKLIEGVAYGCVSASELGGANLSEETLDAYDARTVFEALRKGDLNFIPRPCSFTFNGGETMEEWNISKKDVARSDQLNSAKDYLNAYKKLHQYAHEFHPRRGHHLLQKDGLDRAIAILGPIKTKLTNSLWQHVMPFGNQALVVDFGQKDARAPETFVFSRGDKNPSWPILFVITDPNK